MPRTTFEPQNKVEVAGEFPRLKLELHERARIACIEDPVYAYVHTFRGPKIVNGKAEEHYLERKDGTKYKTFKLDFIGRPQCFGDLGILQDKGVDVKNCPACAMAKSTDMVDPPQRRFAMHVVKYATRQGTFELATPFSVQIVVWSFTDTTFNKLVDFSQLWGPLKEHDLNLGPCSNRDFQKFDIAITPTAAYLEDDPDSSVDRKRHTALAFKENQTKDLEAFCGRKVERSWMEEDLEKIRSRWRIANGEPQSIEYSSADTPTLTEGLEDLLSVGSDSPAPEPSFSARPASSKSEPVPDLGDILSSDNGSDSKASKSSSAVSFEDLLADLNVKDD